MPEGRHHCADCLGLLSAVRVTADFALPPVEVEHLPSLFSGAVLGVLVSIRLQIDADHAAAALDMPARLATGLRGLLVPEAAHHYCWCGKLRFGGAGDQGPGSLSCPRRTLAEDQVSLRASTLCRAQNHFPGVIIKPAVLGVEAGRRDIPRRGVAPDGVLGTVLCSWPLRLVDMLTSEVVVGLRVQQV